METVNVTNTEYVRDINTMALVKNNPRALAPHRRYIERRSKEESTINELNNLKNRIAQLESQTSELDEIKSLLTQLGLKNNG
jgi:mannosyltransferase OCH1-like enzyme